MLYGIEEMPDWLYVYAGMAILSSRIVHVCRCVKRRDTISTNQNVSIKYIHRDGLEPSLTIPPVTVTVPTINNGPRIIFLVFIRPHDLSKRLSMPTSRLLGVTGMVMGGFVGKGMLAVTTLLGSLGGCRRTSLTMAIDVTEFAL